MSPVDRVRAYAVFCATQAKLARAEVDVAVTSLLVARTAAEDALDRCNAACEYAERIATFAARAMAGDVDDETLLIAALAIEELVEPKERAA